MHGMSILVHEMYFFVNEVMSMFFFENVFWLFKSQKNDGTFCGNVFSKTTTYLSYSNILYI